MASEITKSSCKLSWDPPDFDGGSPIVHYVLQVSIAVLVPRQLEAALGHKQKLILPLCLMCVCSAGRLAGGRMST